MRSRCWFGLLALLAMVSPTRAQALQQQTGSFVLSVRGAYRFSETSTEALAELSVSIPLDRVARATGARSPSPRRAPALALAASAAALAQVPAAPQDPSSEAAAQPAPPPAAPRPSPAFELTPSLVRATVAAALRAAGYRKLERRFESLASRARVSAAFPELRLRGARGFDYTRRLSPTTADPYRYTEAGAADLLLEARLSWKLDRLLFADEEIAIERLRHSARAERRALVSRVIAALIAWQRAALDRAVAVLPEERLEAELRALAAVVELDLLTDGWFSARIEERPHPEVAAEGRKR
ncbi:MAG TPA: hypothetical protein VKZ49_12725 [Polyangiaceae bacterium]|nr:hypothetical protein [Polyangiaceae bacterium]